MNFQKILSTIIITFLLIAASCEGQGDNGSGTTVEPEINIKTGSTDIPSGNAYDFGEVTVGETSAAVTFTIGNQGDADLTLSATPSIELIGADLDQFDLTLPGTSTIAAGEETTFTVSFSPATESLKTASLVIANNDSDEGAYIIELTGTGVVAGSPEIDITQDLTSIASGGSHNFGDVSVDVDSQAVFTITNNGSAALELTGTPLVSITGSDALMFAVVQPEASIIDAGGNTTFSITFTPTSLGAKSASISIENNDSDEGVYTINVSGNGTPSNTEINLLANSSPVASGGSYNFGIFTTGTTSAPITFEIENNGTEDLNLTGVPAVILTDSGSGHASEFSITQPALTAITSGSSATFTITYEPTLTGAVVGVYIEIQSNDFDEANYIINLDGTGLAPAPEMDLLADSSPLVDGGTHNFGSEVSGTSGTPVVFTIQNNGTGDLTLGGAPTVLITDGGSGHAGEFSITQPSSTTITPSSNTTFTITYEPTFVGATVGVYATITNNDSDENPYVFNMTGVGAAAPEPEIAVEESSADIPSGGSFNFGNQEQGTTGGSVTFTIKNTGTGDLNLTGSPYVDVSGTDASEFSVDVQPSTPVSPTGNTTFNMTFSPDTSGTGGRSALITIPNNDTDEGTFTINLSGTAKDPVCVIGDNPDGKLGACHLTSW
jgi:hypothetical protein